ncbi:hypothetical protein C0992_005460 [Termitomyces sp. T32_za158]|nr:hypothetical protein C0992_005460 [Termitomyces sp. T32_za158]
MREVAIECERAEERYQHLIQGTQSLEVLAKIQGEAGTSTENANGVSNDADIAMEVSDNGWEDVTLPDVPDDTLEHALRDAVHSRFHTRVYADKRTWRQRIRRLHLNWEPLLPSLADAYLKWKYGPVTNSEVTPDGRLGARDTDTNSEVTPDSGLRDNTNYDFMIDIIDIFMLDTQVTIRQAATSKSVAESLVSQGYLGAMPDQPTIALSLWTLDLFLKIKRRKASFSVDAFAKVLCDVYSIPFRRRYRDALSNAFDAYLGILHVIDKRVAKELGCDGDNWQVLNACPPCTYQLEGEPPLKFSRMVVVDGNNSLKRVRITGERNIGDDQTFEESDYYLTHEYVDRYANKVKSCKRNNLCNNSQDDPDPPVMIPQDNPDAPTPLNDANATDADLQGGDPTDGALTGSGAPSCTEKWKAAAADAKKKMWAIFDEAGIFASCCRHGLILWIMDLMRSGELRVFIDLFFRQWDAEKYENLATMLYNNYVQALRIIEHEAPELKKSKAYFNIQPGDLEKWRLEELHHFSTLGEEPEEDILKITYVELLLQLREIK